MARSISLGSVNILSMGERTCHSGGNGCGPNLGPLCDLWWQCRTRTSAQTPAMVEPWTPTWSSSVAGSGCYHCPGGRMALRHLHGPWFLLTTCLSMVTDALDINTDPRCSWATDPNMVLSCPSGPDITITLCSNADHSDLDASWPLDSGY